MSTPHANAHPAALAADADPPERLDSTSLDVAADRAAQLRELFPEAVREGEIDFDALKRSVGQWVDPGKERFGLSWPGKAACMKTIQQPSVGTLLPDRAESVAFDATRNVIIEGDNLEVLKLLQKGYYGTVKMIYIDPPYNTGNEFIYPDNFQEGLQTYLRYSGQVDATGARLSTNTETSGRYHTNWLNMMYPRLYLARNLLREDGIIFVSIDDNEMARLRIVMDEVFGEENFVAQIIWKKRSSPPNDKIIGANHDYIVIYARSADYAGLNLRQRTDEQLTRYRNPDNHPKGPWAPGDLMANVKGGRYVASLYYPIVNPTTGEEHYPSSNGNWRFNKQRIAELLANDEISFGENGRGRPKLKRFLCDVKDGITYGTIWDFVPLNTDASREMGSLLGNMTAFENPKPSGLIAELVRLGSSDDGLVLDFFAGSGTTAHSVMTANQADGGERRFMLVQLPEPIENGDYPTIAALTRERVRRVAQSLMESQAGQLALSGAQSPGLGFRAYRLAESNFVPWDGDPGAGSIARQLELAADNLRPGREQDPEAILTEILLRAGYALTAPVQRLALGGAEVFSVDGGALMACLARPLTMAVVEAMAARDPAQIVVLDAGFDGDDELKVNAAQAVRARPNTVLKVV